MSDENFGKTRLRRRSARSSARPVLRIVDRKCHGFEVALVVKPGFLDEPLIVRIVRDREERLPAIRFANPAQIGVQERVRPGQEPRRFGRCVLAQLHGYGQHRPYDYDPESNRKSASDSHGMRLEWNDSILLALRKDGTVRSLHVSVAPKLSLVIP